VKHIGWLEEHVLALDWERKLLPAGGVPTVNSNLISSPTPRCRTAPLGVVALPLTPETCRKELAIDAIVSGQDVSSTRARSDANDVFGFVTCAPTCVRRSDQGGHERTLTAKVMISLLKFQAPEWNHSKTSTHGRFR
jgi:hypothetical protein